MLSLFINEIFYSLQGEGIRTGAPSIFIRLKGCDLSCGFCDTEFNSGKELSLEEIKEYIKKFPCKTIVWTGGEPALQLTDEHIKYFKVLGYFQCIETNGNNKVSSQIDHITLSPKVAEHILLKNFPNGVTEIKYVRHAGQFVLPETGIKAEHYYISPLNDGDKINYKNLYHCINLIKENNKWKLTMQMQKIWKML